RRQQHRCRDQQGEDVNQRTAREGRLAEQQPGHQQQEADRADRSQGSHMVLVDQWRVWAAIGALKLSEWSQTVSSDRKQELANLQPILLSLARVAKDGSGVGTMPPPINERG